MAQEPLMRRHNSGTRQARGDAAGHRVLPALVVGRTTPGLRTVTVVAAAATLLLRRGRRGRATRVLAEGACPAPASDSTEATGTERA
jgi:hypothetical protein